MRALAIVVFLAFIGQGSNGQQYQAWLDSMDSPGYIANEYRLEEIVVEQEADLLSKKTAFYRQHTLTSTDDVLESIEGVWMVKRGNYAAEPVMRGLSAGQINVTIDGMRILGACTDKMDPVTSYIEPNNLDKIEVSQGACGCRSGSTTGGSMDFSIKKPVFCENKIGGKVSSRYSSAAGAIEHLAGINYAGKEWAFNAGITYRKGDDYRAGGGTVVKHSAYNKINYSTSVSWRLRQNKLLNVSFIGDDGWDIGYPALPMDVAYAKAKMAGLQYDQWQTGQLFDHFQFKAYLNKVDHAMDDSQREVEMHMDMPGYTRTQGGYFQADLRESNPIKGNLKLDAYHTFAHAEMTMYSPNAPEMFMLTWPDIDRFVVAGNGHFEIPLNIKLQLMSDWRIERNHARMTSDLGENQFEVFGYDGQTKPSWLINSGLALMFHPGNVWESKLLLAYGERMPNEGEQFGFYLFNSYDGYDYIGHPNLNKEKSLQAELMFGATTTSWEWKMNLFGYRFFDYIYSKVDTELSPMTVGANGVKVYENISGAYLLGAENTLMFSQGPVTAMASAKYVYGEGSKGQALPLVPPFKANVSVRYQFPIGAGLRFESETAARQNKINPDFNELSTPGYSILNIGADYQWKLKSETTMKFTVGVDNVFDKNYHEHLDWGAIPRPGRNVSVGVTYLF